jgi:group I intron endonuclease
MIGIYKITSPLGKIYIGQSIDIQKRFATHKRLGCKKSILLYNSLKKYGVNNHKFEIIEECESSELNKKERHYQDLYFSTGEKGLNLLLTKTNDLSGKRSLETCKKISLAQIGKSRHKHTEETKEKLRKINLGKKDTQEVRLKKSLSAKNKPKYSEQSLLNMSLGQKRLNKKISEEQKEKFRSKVKGRRYSEEEKEKLYASRRGKRNIKKNIIK